MATTRFLMSSVPQIVGSSPEAVQAQRDALLGRARSRVSWMLANAPTIELRFSAQRKRLRVVYALAGHAEPGSILAPTDDAFPLRRVWCESNDAVDDGKESECWRRATRVVHAGNVASAAHFGGAIPWLRLPMGTAGAYRLRVGARLRRVDGTGAWRAVCAAVLRDEGSLVLRARRVPLSTTNASMLRATLDLLERSLGQAGELGREDPRRTIRELLEVGQGWQVALLLRSPRGGALRGAIHADLDGAFEREGTPQEPDESEGTATEHALLWGRSEVTELFTPPWTDAEPLAGLRHHLPLMIPRALPHRDVRGTRSLRIGTVRDDAAITREVRVQAEDLARHVLILGATGTGKTHSTLQLLAQIRAMRIPFLVVDPVNAQGDYAREARRREWESEVQILDLSTPEGTPTFNPFIPPPGVSVSEYAGVLAAALTLGFSTTHVAYEIMRKLILDTYLAWAQRAAPGEETSWASLRHVDRGALGKAPPTFDAFLDEAPRFLEKLSPSDRPSRWTMETIEHFTRRFELLRASTLKIVFSPENADATIDPLFENSTILELGRIHAPDEAVALAGVILGLLITHRRSQGADGTGLRHVLVLEEAHRLMPRLADRGSDREIRASAASQLSDMLSDFVRESRKWGQALIMVEQEPGGLRSDAIANAATVIAHQLHDLDDRKEAVTALGLREQHEHALQSLDVGQAWVRLPGEHLPFRVRVPHDALRRRG